MVSPKFCGPIVAADPGLRSKSMPAMNWLGKNAQEWCVGSSVVATNSVHSHGILTILEAAEVGLAIAEAHAIRIYAERPRRHLEQLGILPPARQNSE